MIVRWRGIGCAIHICIERLCEKATQVVFALAMAFLLKIFLIFVYCGRLLWGGTLSAWQAHTVRLNPASRGGGRAIFFGGLPLSSGKREAFVSGRARRHENVNAMERIYYIETAFGHSLCQAAEEGEHHVQEHG